MAYRIQQHLAYNAWANKEVAEMLRGVADTIYFRENKSSFPSISKTVLHIWDAENIWLNRMKGHPPGTLPSAYAKNSRYDSLDGLVQSSSDLAMYFAMKDDSFLAGTYDYKNTKGEPFVDSYEETLYHIVNHSTYHRGQIIAMLREAGVTSVVSTDLIHYLREIKK